MDYSKYYTPLEVAEFLVAQLNIKKPDKAIDICCGSCNLLKAVSKRWNEVKLFGVDVINNIDSDIIFSCEDGRNFAINSKDKYPLVLANPPFDKITINNEYPDLYSKLYNCKKTTRLEIEMLYANLLLLENNGTLLIILPSTFVTAERYEKYRVYLATKYTISGIYELPIDTFGAKSIRTHALVIKNCRPYKSRTFSYKLCNSGNCYSIISKTIISQQFMRLGIWDEYSKNNNINVEYSCKRGNISSNMFSKKGEKLLHTSGIKEEWHPSIRFTDREIKNPVYANKGDIIISRIGQSAGSFCVYRGDKIMLSDCLFKLDDPEGIIAKSLYGYKYNYPTRGVATQYITINDFLNWCNSIIIKN